MKQLVNATGLRAAHEALLRMLREAAAETLEEAGDFGKHSVETQSGFKHPTGNLASKTETKVVRLRSGALLTLKNRAKYAFAQEYGSGIHASRGTRAKYPILPKRGKFLRFTVNGKVIFARKVMHPGVRPTRFLFRGASAAGAHEKNLMRTAMDRIARRFNRIRV